MITTAIIIYVGILVIYLLERDIERIRDDWEDR